MHTLKIKFYQQNFLLKNTRRNRDFQQMQFNEFEFIIGKIEKFIQRMQKYCLT